MTCSECGIESNMTASSVNTCECEDGYINLCDECCDELNCRVKEESKG